MKLAVAQLHISSKKEQNLQKILAFIAKAAAQGADMILFPEMAQGVSTRADKIQPAALAEPLDGAFIRALQQAARQRGLYVACGVYEQNPQDLSRPFNTLIVLDDMGRLLYSYRKTHLYDIARYKESDFICPGESAPQIVTTKFGKFGFFTCYELRFPEIARSLVLQGAEVLFIPTAWMKGSKKIEQLHILARARAVENGVFTVIADQCGNAYCGGSGIYAPSGIILDEAAIYTEEALLFAELDFEKGRKFRQSVPSLEHRRREIYNL